MELRKDVHMTERVALLADTVVTFFVRDKGSITTSNKGNPTAVKVKHAFPTTTTTVEFRNSF